MKKLSQLHKVTHLLKNGAKIRYSIGSPDYFPSVWWLLHGEGLSWGLGQLDPAGTAHPLADSLSDGPGAEPSSDSAMGNFKSFHSSTKTPQTLLAK